MERDSETIYLVSKFQEAERAGDDVERNRYFIKLLAKYNDLIYYIVKKFPIPPRVGIDDVIAVAQAGLWKGFKRFDPNISKATTYLTRVINGEILRYYRDYCWQWKVPRRLKEAVSGNKDIKDISKKYNLSEDEIVEIQNILRSNISHEDYLEHSDNDDTFMEEVHKSAIVSHMVNFLTDEEASVVKLFYLEDRSVTDISDITGLDISSVKQMLQESLSKLQTHFSDVDIHT